MTRHFPYTDPPVPPRVPNGIPRPVPRKFFPPTAVTAPLKSNTDEEDFSHAVDLTIITVGLSRQTPNTFTSLALAIGFGRTENYRIEDLGNKDLVDGSLSMTTVSVFLGASFEL